MLGCRLYHSIIIVIKIEAMTNQVHEMFPHLSMDALQNLIRTTGSINLAVEAILGGVLNNNQINEQNLIDANANDVRFLFIYS